MSYSEKQRQYNDKYDAENMIAYTVKYQRSIYDAVEKAMEKLEWTGINGQLLRFWKSWKEMDFWASEDVVFNTMCNGVDNFML